MYDLSAVFDSDTASALTPGSNILVIDPQRGADELILSVLVDGLTATQGTVIVTTEQPAAAVLDSLGSRIDFDPRAVCVIDCQGDGEREQHELDTGVFVYSVPSPDDLTGIGLGLTNCVRRLEAAGFDHSRVGFLSLSGILAATAEEDTFKFTHVVSSRLDAADFLGVFGLDGSHAADSRRVLTEAFDVTVELRTGVDGREYCLHKRSEGPTEWHSFE